MKKEIALLIAVFIAIQVVAASNVEREIPLRSDPGASFDVTLQIHDLQLYKLFTIEDALPPDFILTEWKISGSMERKEDVATRFVDSKYGWSFTAANESVTLSYKVTAPYANDSYTFEAVWFDASGHGKNSSTILVNIVSCGDNICDVNEDCESCFKDCSCPYSQRCEEAVCVHYCGNSVCDEDEDSITCLDDCPLTEEQIIEGLGEEQEKQFPTLLILITSVILVILIVIVIVIKKKVKS